MKHAFAVAALAAVLGHSLPVLACGATAPPYYVVDQLAPGAADVPLNAPIQVTLKEGADGPVVNALEPTLSLTKLGDEQAVALKPLLGAPTLAWLPLQPLAPSTTYEAHYNPGYEGQPDTIWQFTTGSGTAPELALQGKLSVTLEAGTDPTYERINDCGSGVQTGTAAVTKARVRLPHAVAGFAGRFGELHVTDERAFDFSTPAKSAPDANEGHLVSLSAYADLESDDEIVLTLPEEAQPYHPCFAFRATDARADEALTEPLCLDQLFPAAETKIEPEPSNSVDDQGRASSSCSFSAPAGGGSGGFAVALLVGALLRRRRSA